MPLRSSHLSMSIFTTMSISDTPCSFAPLWGHFASARQFPKFRNNACRTVLSPLCRMWQCLVSGLLTLLFPVGTPSFWFSHRVCLSARLRKIHFRSTPFYLHLTDVQHRRFWQKHLCKCLLNLPVQSSAMGLPSSLLQHSQVPLPFLAHGVWHFCWADFTLNNLISL